MPSLPFTPRRVVIGTDAHAEIARYVAARRPDLELRSASLSQVTAQDLEWAQAFVGFRKPPVGTLGSVEWVHCTGAGVDAWLYPEGIDPSILITRTPESFGPAIAEWVIARVLAFSQDLPALATAQRQHLWSPRETTRLAGTRALIVGFGDIGRSIAHFLQVFDVEVSAVTRSGQSDSPVLREVHAIGALPDLVDNVQWLIVTLPLTKETHHLIDRSLLSRCRGAVLVNTGRGPVIQEAAIPEALSNGWLSGAALDVFEEEPLPPDSPLWDDARVMVSPHMSGKTTVEGAAGGFLECLQSLERGVLPRWAINRERGY